MSALLIGAPSAPVWAADDPGARPPPEPRAETGFDCAEVVRADRPVPVAECEALVRFFHLTDGPSWEFREGWDQTTAICERWAGVGCEELDDGWHVTSIMLRDERLSGVFGVPPGSGSDADLTAGRWLAELPHLRVLRLDRPELRGMTPDDLERLDPPRLHGTIAPELGRLRHLETLLLTANALTGAIPAAIAELPRLTEFSAADNELTGPIPEGLMGACAGCDETGRFGALDLSGNDLSGPPPTDLGRTRLGRIDVHDNPLLSGPLPTSWAGVTDVTFLRFTGTGICVPADAAIRAWLDAVTTVQPHRDADCEATGAGPGTPPLTPAPASAPAVTPDPAGLGGGPVPTLEPIDAVAHAYAAILVRSEARGAEIAAAFEAVRLPYDESEVDLLVSIYGEQAALADELVRAVEALAFPAELQAEVDELLSAGRLEADLWTRMASDRQAIAADRVAAAVEASRARQAAEERLLIAVRRRLR